MSPAGPFGPAGIADDVGTTVTAAEITVEGLVQGVGFRAYTQRRASELGLAGDVVNLRDGRVRVRAEGRRAAIDALVQHLERGPRLARVSRVLVTWQSPTGRGSAFTIGDGEREW
jgi:acylphosphatase